MDLKHKSHKRQKVADNKLSELYSLLVKLLKPRKNDSTGISKMLSDGVDAESVLNHFADVATPQEITDFMDTLSASYGVEPSSSMSLLDYLKATGISCDEACHVLTKFLAPTYQAVLADSYNFAAPSVETLAKKLKAGDVLVPTNHFKTIDSKKLEKLVGKKVMDSERVAGLTVLWT